jgi:ABC-type branched-subunit amino acid transport system ATPase component
MLSISRALMTHPELLILDEATEGLAPLIVAEIWRVIKDIRSSGIATLIVDRDWRKVRSIPIENCFAKRSSCSSRSTPQKSISIQIYRNIGI